MGVIEDHRKRVGGRIFAARKEAKLTLDGLAEKIGSSRHHLIRLERGAHTPKPETIAAIAEATGKPESYFDDDEDEESDPAVTFLKAVRRYAREQAREVLREERKAAQS